MATIREFIKTAPQDHTLRQVAIAKHENLMSGNLDVYIQLLTVENKLQKVPYLCKSFSVGQLDIDIGGEL